MSKRSQQKRQARSKEKKVAKRRLMGASPLARLAGDPAETCECWRSYSTDKDTNRIVSLHVLRPVRGGGTVAAFFLVDYDCLGLKDAFYRLDADAGEIRAMMRESSNAEDDLRYVRIGVEEVRNIVAAAIRWNQDQEIFKLPPATERAVKILGGLPDLETVDTREFGDDGGLLYVGRRADLEKRLSGITLEEFMDREDVEIVFQGHGGEEFDDNEEYDPDWMADESDQNDVTEAEMVEMDAAEEEFHKNQDAIKRKMMDAVRQWCFAHGQAPHPLLEEAIGISFAASAEALDQPDDQARVEKTRAITEQLLDLETPESRAALRQAMQQYTDFARSFKSEAGLAQALGMDEDSD